MYAVSVDELRAKGQEKVVAAGSARSIRLVTAADELGFSLSDVRLKAGARNVLWYKHHWEANLILAGTCEVTDLSTGKVHTYGAGTCYVVGPKDRHSVHAVTDLHILSIFNPPLRGDEQHDAEGTIPAYAPHPPGPAHQR